MKKPKKSERLVCVNWDKEAPARVKKAAKG